jgi:hypothetical protein
LPEQLEYVPLARRIAMYFQYDETPSHYTWLVTQRLSDNFPNRWICYTYLCMELSPSWEAANYAAIQEIPTNFKEPEGSSPPLVPILSQFHPVHTIPSYLSSG